MEKENTLKAALFAVFLFLHPIGFSDAQHYPYPYYAPLCVQQFALVNHACGRLPNYPPGPAPTPPEPDNPPPPAPTPTPTPDAPPTPDSPPPPSNASHHGHRHGHGHNRHGHRHGDGHNRHRHGHGHGHHRHGHSHNWYGLGRNRQRQRQRAGNGAEEECCKWLKQVDTECVCGVLIRLPPFLSRPRHDYIVTVHDECNVTYTCPPPLRP